MRWTIPTLVQVLVDAGVSPGEAGGIVAITYPGTHGDTFYRSDLVDPNLGHALGVYALWNTNRGDRVDITGTKPSDDARTIAQLLRLNPRALGPVVYCDGPRDTAVDTVVAKTVQAIRMGDHFEPATVPEDEMAADRVAELYQSMRRLEGLPDYIASVPLPHFNG